MHRDRSTRRRRLASRRKTAGPERPPGAGTPAGEPSQTSTARREQTTKRRGELAELAFALKAASLGFGVSRPWGDSERYDFILDADALHSSAHAPQKARGDSSNLGAPSPGHTLLKTRDTSGPGGSKAERGIPAAADRTSAHHAPAKKPRHTPPLSDAPPSPPSRLWRVQVKGSTQIINGLYHVNSCRRVAGHAIPYTPAEIDFFAAYIIPEDTWYILPLHALHGVTSLLFRRRRDRRPGLYDAYREAWHLLRPK